MSYDKHDDDFDGDDSEHLTDVPQGIATGDLVRAGQTSRLAGLQQLRDILANQLETTVSGRDMAALSSRFSDVLAQIDELEGTGGQGAGAAGAEVTSVDEFTARRKARST